MSTITPEELQAEWDALARWKAEALPVIAGLAAGSCRPDRERGKQ